jgi:hypothetical protein
MKDKIDSILDNMKERLSNPLVFSYLISWTLINWRITLALLWYDPPKDANAHLSLIQYVEQNSQWQTSLLYPLLCAIAYTTLMPIIRQSITALHNIIDKKGDAFNLKIQGGSVIPFDKFLKLREDYQTRTNILQKAINDEAEKQSQIDQLTTSLLTTQQKSNEVASRHSEMERLLFVMDRVELIDGYWTFSSKLPLLKEHATLHIEFRDNNVYVLQDGQFLERFRIHNFNYDERRSKVFFAFLIPPTKEDFGNDHTAPRLSAVFNLDYKPAIMLGSVHTMEGFAAVSFSKDGAPPLVEVEHKKPKKIYTQQDE